MCVLSRRLCLPGGVGRVAEYVSAPKTTKANNWDLRPLSVLGVGNSHIRLHQQGSIVEGETTQERKRGKVSRVLGFAGFDMDLRVYTSIYALNNVL
jgi:hypothetical protein